jgi:hypothetical protein
MNVHFAVVVIALGWSITLHGQTQTSAPFAGCYEIVSQKWHPGNEDASPIPSRFELRNEQADKRSTDFFQMRGIPPGPQRLGETLVVAAKGRWCLGIVGEWVRRISWNPEAPEWRFFRSDQGVVRLALRVEETGSRDSDSQDPMRRVILL